MPGNLTDKAGRLPGRALEPGRTRSSLPATAIGHHIDSFYNPVRRHSALDFSSPAMVITHPLAGFGDR